MWSTFSVYSSRVGTLAVRTPVVWFSSWTLHDRFSRKTDYFYKSDFLEQKVVWTYVSITFINEIFISTGRNTPVSG